MGVDADEFACGFGVRQQLVYWRAEVTLSQQQQAAAAAHDAERAQVLIVYWPKADASSSSSYGVLFLLVACVGRGLAFKSTPTLLDVFHDGC